MTHTFFISDLHLAPEYPAITEALIGFLKTTASGADTLYILGDLFDAWMGDDDHSPHCLQVASILKEYAASGTEVFFMHGNRDFLLGEAFAKRCNLSLLTDPTVINLPQGEALLMHGDSLCTGDREYLNFRAMVRSPQWQQQVLAKSLAERKALAAQLRATSQSMNSIKAEDIMDVTADEVVRMMGQHQCQILIHGHTHRPARHSLKVNRMPGERIVLGDWHQQGWYLYSSETNLELRSFPIHQS